jgi:flagellar hook protein FlgE
MNTIGFKACRATTRDVPPQTVSTTARPAQIGRGSYTACTATYSPQGVMDPNDASTDPTGDTQTVGTNAAHPPEQSNVDIAGEMVNTITARHGFAANAKMVTTADEMIENVIDLLA